MLEDCAQALEEVLDAFDDLDDGHANRGYKSAVDLEANCRKIAARGLNRKDRHQWRYKVKYYLSQGYLADLRWARSGCEDFH